MIYRCFLSLSIPHKCLWWDNKGLPRWAWCKCLILVSVIFRWLVLPQQRDLWFQVPKYTPTNELIRVAPNKKRLVSWPCFKTDDIRVPHVTCFTLSSIKTCVWSVILWLLDLQELEYCLLKQRKTHTGTMQTLCRYSQCECVLLGCYLHWIQH